MGDTVDSGNGDAAFIGSSEQSSVDNTGHRKRWMGDADGSGSWCGGEPCAAGDGGAVEDAGGAGRKALRGPVAIVVASELAGQLGLPVRWSAGPQEAMEDAVRFENLYHLACWLACARVYIGNDSGITHLAAAVGTPVVAIFGPTDAAVWAPRGERVSVVSAGSLDAISVEAVLQAVNAPADIIGSLEGAS